MINIVVELSKYVILTLMIIYTILCYYLVVGKHASDRKGLLQTQISLTFFLDFTAFLVVFLKTFDFKVAVFYAEMMVYFAAILILYRRIYKNASMLLLNNMCMLLSVGFIMLCRLDIASANKQLLIVACGSAVALVIPVMIRKMKFLKAAYLDLCRRGRCPSGSRSCAGPDQLWCEAFPYGHSAL